MKDEVERKKLDLSKHSAEFLIAEHQSLRIEVTDKIKDVVKLEIAVVTLTGVFWAWVFENNVSNDLRFIVFAPILITIFIFFKRKAMIRGVKEISTYLKKVENTFGVTNELGWEHFAEVQRTKRDHGSLRYFDLFWVFIIVCNVFMPVYYLVK